MTELKDYLTYWNEAHRIGLEFYKNLPDNERKAMHKRLERLYPDGKSEQLIKQYETKGELKTPLLKILVDFVPIEQTLRLFRCEIWGEFAKKKPQAVSIDGMWIQAANLLSHLKRLKERAHFKSEWYASERYTPEHIDEIFRAEIYAFLQYLAHCLACAEEDIEIMMPAVRRIYNSIEEATYKIHFLQMEILLRHGKNEEMSNEHELNRAKEYISVEIPRPYLVNIQENNPFSVAVGEYLAGIAFALEQERNVKLPQLEQNKGHLQEIIDNFRQNNFNSRFSETKAVFEMQNGAFMLTFSTKRLLYKGFLLKPLGYVLLVVSVLLSILSAQLFPFALIILIPCILTAIRMIS